MIIPVFVPHGGCPERCSFCDQSVSGGDPASAVRVAALIERHLETGAVATEVAFYGGTFTALPRDRQLAYLEAVRPHLESGRVAGIRIATRPDAIEAPWLARLRDEYRLTTVELGAQSFNTRVLNALGRSHAPDDTRAAVASLRRLGLAVGLHLMIGCPGEEIGDDERTASAVLELKPELARIHPLLVLKGTELEKHWREGRFAPLGLEDAVGRAARLTRVLENGGVRVIRLGLQANELLGAAVVAGPYSPGFGDLVRGRILREAVASRLSRQNRPGRGPHIARITLPERFSGSFRGPGGSNMIWLKDRFDLSTIEVDVVKGGTLTYDDIEVRIHHSAGPAERGQIEPPQPPGR